VLRELVAELLNKSYVVFAVKGYGSGRNFSEALQDAKKPINIPSGFRYDGFRDLSITKSTLDLCEAGAVTAIAVPGINNGLYLLDLEADLVKFLGDGLYALFPPHEVYVEHTPRGGAHVILRADVEPPNYQGVKGFLDVKYRGYVVIAPSEFRLRYGGRFKILKYVPASPINIWETAPLSRYLRSVDRLFSVVDSEVLAVTRIESRPDLSTVSDDVADVIAALPVDQLLAVAYIVFNLIGCGGCVNHYVSKLMVGEPIDVPNATYPTSIQRGLHAVFEVELFGALRILGASDEQLRGVLERFRYLDHVPETPPERNVRYNVMRGVYSIAFKGVCPVMVANRLTGRYVPPHGCVTTLARRLASYVSQNEGAVLDAVRGVMEAVR